jgi:hypothetical protein
LAQKAGISFGNHPNRAKIAQEQKMRNNVNDLPWAPPWDRDENEEVANA